MTLPLTERQERLWRFIASCDRSPTYDEMAVAMGDKVRGAALHHTVEVLEAKGFVRRVPGRSRAIVAVAPDFNLLHVSTAELAAELTRRLVEA